MNSVDDRLMQLEILRRLFLFLPVQRPGFISSHQTQYLVFKFIKMLPFLVALMFFHALVYHSIVGSGESKASAICSAEW